MALYYTDTLLKMGGVDKEIDLLSLIAQNEGHACYVYDLDNLSKRYDFLKAHVYSPDRLSIHYAVKANGNPDILKLLKKKGARVDIVSGGELDLVLSCGFTGEDVIFSGVAKSVDEIEKAITHNIKQINVESPQELERIGQIARRMGKKANVAFRLNPEVNPQTHPYITTGMSENKFGMDQSFIPQLLRIVQEFEEELVLCGLTMHIGSQILELGVMEEAIVKIHGVYKDLKKRGYPLKSLDIGGGVGVHYGTDEESKDFDLVRQYGDHVKNSLKDFEDELLIEPGRILVARCGVLLCQVEYIKETDHKNFAIVNTGMHHLLRPALYQASHRILPVKVNRDKPFKIYDVVGPICESSDFLGKDRIFKELSQGDYLAICDSGAYGYSMASAYNAHPLPKEFIL